MENNPAILLPIIVLLPLLGGIVNGLIGKRLPKQATYFVANAAVLGSFALSVQAFLALRTATVVNPDAAFRFEAFRWIAAGSYSFDMAFLLDPLSAVMILVVTGVGFLVHLYSTAYMDHDAGIARYFSYLNLFIFSMLMLVLGKNLAMLFIGWEGVGACSYLLIGFWFKDMDKAEAGQKAFVVNRIGDIGFVVAIFLLLAYGNGSVDYDALKSMFSDKVATVAHAPTITLICLLLFVGAAGKSAQIPLYVWLPDAMAGPTPVSALIHAATMVTAGVYMIARLNFLFALSPHAMTVVMLVGALTALVAASIGLVQNDIKKVLAYSTVSQLGYMFIAVGAGAFAAGIFHLFTHAFFKACLFLGAGAVIHALHHEQDIRKMGGLAKKLPVIRTTFLVSCIAIAGLPPLAGFFSKDAILAETVAFHPDLDRLEKYYGPGFQRQAETHAVGAAIRAGKSPGEVDRADVTKKAAELKAEWRASVERLAVARKIAFALGLLAALMTAFYMFRLYLMTFSGSYRGDHHTYDHAHDAPWPMGVPLQILAVLSVCAGWLGTPFNHGHWNKFSQWLDPVLARGKELVTGHLEPAVEYGLMGLSVAVAATGVALAWSLYKAGPTEKTAQMAQSLRPIYATLLNKYWVDEAYHAVLVLPLRWISQFLFQLVDRLLVDGLMVRGPGMVLIGFSHLGRLVQTGEVQTYLVGVAVGLAALTWYLI
ncbi:MAG: NADH-quinone oxidoreductase subunit L [Deltaproteobacteria bacterium]|nr:NADH-quinone oxidoreductase subunit L [Deltaproteobacteria bacterium]